MGNDVFKLFRVCKISTLFTPTVKTSYYKIFNLIQLLVNLSRFTILTVCEHFL